MFRAISRSSSGGKIVLTQHLVSSLSVSDRPVHRLRKIILNQCTERSLTESDDTRCYINTIWPPEDEQDIARNMYMWRIVINVFEKKICASSWSLAKVSNSRLHPFKPFTFLGILCYCHKQNKLLETRPHWRRKCLSRRHMKTCRGIPTNGRVLTVWVVVVAEFYILFTVHPCIIL